MRRIRVLIIDPAISSRRRMVLALEGEPDLEVVGTTIPGPDAIMKVGLLQPDLIVMRLLPSDTEGLESLGQLHEARPDLPILVAGPEVVRGAELTLEAISRGATGCVGYSLESPTDRVRADLMAKVRSLTSTQGRSREAESTERSPHQVIPRSASGIDAVVIGSSTGAPNVLAALFAALPADFPVPVLIAQHIDANFVKSLALRLEKLCKFPVREAVHGEQAGPATAWIGPIGLHLAVERRSNGIRLRLEDGEPENGFRPSADVLFRSAARALDGRVLGVILTGMGFDGLRGSREVCAAGGRVIVQDEASSICWGMPGSVVNAGLASRILTPAEIGPEIVRMVRASRSIPQPV